MALNIKAPGVRTSSMYSVKVADSGLREGLAGSGNIRRLLAAGLLVTSVILLATAGGGETHPEEDIRQLSIGLMVLGLTGLLAMAGPDPIRSQLAGGRLGPWGCIGFFLFWGVATLTWYHQHFGQFTLVAPESIARACMIAALGFSVWVAAYLSSVGLLPLKVAQRALRYVVPSPALKNVTLARGMFLTFVGLSASAAQLKLGQYGYLGNVSAALASGSRSAQFIGLLTPLGNFGLAVAVVAHFRAPSGKSMSVCALLGTLLLATTAYGGTKEGVLLVGLTLILAGAAARKKLSLRSVVVFAILTVTVIEPFNVAYRNSLRNQGARVTGLTAQASIAVGAAVDAFGRVGFPGAKDSATRLLIRAREVDNLGIVVQKTPGTIPYRDPREYLSAPFVGIIPRVVWPNKPVFDVGYRFSQQYYELPTSLQTSSAITPFGDLYRHGGILVLVVGLFFLGAVARVLDETARSSRSLASLFLVLGLLPLTIKWETDVLTLMLGWPTLLLPPAIAVRILGVPKS